MAHETLCRQNTKIEDFIDQNFGTIPEGKSEALDIAEYRVIVNRDIVRDTRFCITVYNTITGKMCHGEVVESRDLTDQLESVMESLATWLARRQLVNTYQPNLT